MALTVSEVGSNFPVATVLGGHFYTWQNMDLTLLSRLRECLWTNSVTNAEHPLAEAHIHWLGIYMANNLPRLLLTSGDLAEMSEASDPTDGDKFPILQVACLIFLLISAEAMVAPLPNGEMPPFPQNFIDQRNNAMLVADELLVYLRQMGGFPARCINQVFAEMDHRLLSRDDLTSPFRELVNSAKEIDDSAEADHPTTIFDPRFAKTLKAFYQELEYVLPPLPNYPHAPKVLPPWSNVAERTAGISEPGPNRPGMGPPGGVIRPDIYQCRFGGWTCPLDTLSGQTTPDDNGRRRADPTTVWKEKAGKLYDEAIAKCLEISSKYFTRKKGGCVEDVEGGWIGILTSTAPPRVKEIRSIVASVFK